MTIQSDFSAANGLACHMGRKLGQCYLGDISGAGSDVRDLIGPIGLFDELVVEYFYRYLGRHSQVIEIKGYFLWHVVCL
jgi:hypothetical protein